MSEEKKGKIQLAKNWLNNELNIFMANLSKRERIYYLIFGIFLFLLPVILTSETLSIVSFRDTGQIGDTIGGITSPFLSFFGSILVYLALKAQIVANDKIQTQFDDQKKIDYKQNFENTFFNMLTIHHDIVKNIDFNTHSFYENADNLQVYISQHNNNLLRSTFPNDKKYNSRDVFKISLDFLRYLIQEDLMLEHQLNRPNEDIIFMRLYDNQLRVRLNDFSQIFNSSNITFLGISENTRFQSIYDGIYFKLSTDFGHYFRNLYRIIKMVDEKKFSDNPIEDYKIKYSYTSIVRAQLSDDEIVWLFFNCLSDKGSEKFKPLLEKYSILKIINKDNETYNFYTKFYEDSAFEKPMEENLEEHVNKFNFSKLV